MKIGPFAIEQCNQKIGEWLTPILPAQVHVPDTTITFHVKEEGDNEIKWAVELVQSYQDFAKMVIGGPLPKPKKIDQILIIGDEILPNGVWVLFSALDRQMLRVKFQTEVESLAYKNHFKDRLGNYVPNKLSRAIARDSWFDGSFSDPDQHGFRDVMKRK